MTMKMNKNGGRTCRWCPAPGYNARGNGELLVSGIRSVAAPWAGFDYDESAITDAPDNRKFPMYHGPGILTQLAGCQADYRGRNMAGGRKALVSYIGAAHRTPEEAWHKGLDGYLGDIRMCFVIDDARARLVPARLQEVQEVNAAVSLRPAA